MQDLNYWFDPVGNITEIQDNAQQTLFFNNAVITPTQKFVYDALYRLIEAKGRELIGTADFGTKDNWNDSHWKTTHKGDGSAVQNYTQKYVYDEVGNILELQHIAGTGSYMRIYVIDTNSNKLLSTEVGSNTYSYGHDAQGNMTAMPHLSAMNWSVQNELSSIMKGSEPTYYQYSNGERVRKFTDKGIIKEERIYLGNFEIYRKFDNGSLTQSTGSVPKVERATVHVSDDTGRIAMLEKRTAGSAADDNGTAEELTRYIYSNHLQSASLELDENGAIISYEEYHPYGTTSYQANNSDIKAVGKRYRYTGKERDEESGLYYHGARYYVPWLARWSSLDPINSENYNMQKGYGLEKNMERQFLDLCASSYEYCYDNPVRFNDANGEQANPLQMVETEWNRLFNTAEKKTTEAIDKSFKVALIGAAYKKAPELLINDLFGTEMSEERKQEIFDTDFEATVGILLYEFATGTGEQHRDFYYSKDKPNSFANKVVEGYVLKDVVEGIYSRVREEFIDNNKDWNWVKDNSFYGFGIEFSPDQTGLRIDKSIKRHIESNSAQFFLGGATVTAYPKGNISANVQIFNETSRSSLMLHLPKENYSIGPLHTISQTIHFKVVNLDPSKTVNFQPDFIDINLNKIKWLRNVLD